MPKPRELHETTDYEFDLLEDRQAALLTLRTGSRKDHSFVLTHEAAARLSAEIAYKLAAEPPPTGGR